MEEDSEDSMAAVGEAVAGMVVVGMVAADGAVTIILRSIHSFIPAILTIITITTIIMVVIIDTIVVPIIGTIMVKLTEYVAIDALAIKKSPAGRGK